MSTLTPTDRRKLAAATNHSDRTIRLVYSGKRIPLASTFTSLARGAAELGLPPPPSKAETLR